MIEYEEIKEDDRELFRQAVGEVLPVRQDTVKTRPARPAPVPYQTRADERAVMEALSLGDFEPEEIQAGEKIRFRRDGVQDRVFHKLQRGQFHVEAELDLHGLNIDTARASLSRFLQEIRTSRQRCVRIIHGKGRGSPEGRPVLKIRLQGWLQQRSEVLAYCSALPQDGGTGAVYVLIKRRPSR